MKLPHLSCSYSGGGDRRCQVTGVPGKCSSCAGVSFCHLPPWRFLDQHWKIPHTHPINHTPWWPNIQKSYSLQLSDRNIVIVISLSYITSFTQHKNRSLTMITIFLNVNLLYILHFQRNIYFYIYAVVTITLKKKLKN